MFKIITSALITGLMTGGALTVTAAPAQAVTPECTTAVSVAVLGGGGRVASTMKGAYAGSTTCWMERGSSGAGVAALQRTLVECYSQNIAVDGSFGPATQQALKNAQASTNRTAGRTVITPDGNYGPQTRYWLFFYGTASDGYRQCEGPLGGWGGR